MARQGLKRSDRWLRNRIHEQLQRLTADSDRLTRTEMARTLGIASIDRSHERGLGDQLQLPLDTQQVKRTDQYLQLLACCGGPFVHGEAISAFDFLTYVELIPEGDFWAIRSEEELSGWVERMRVLFGCGYLETRLVERARLKVQHLLRRRLLNSDLESQLWYAAFCYLAERSTADSSLAASPAAD